MTSAKDRPATLADVAALAGVSQMTVSRVINGAAYVSERRRQDVQRAIEETGYVTHQAARSLVTRRTNSIAFVVAESQHQFFTDPVFGAMVLGANERLSADDLQLVTIVCTTPADRSRASRYIRAGHVDGALLASFRRDDPLLAEVSRAGVPAVMAGRPLRSVRIPYVDVNNRRGARDITQYLVELGCRRICTITGPLEMSSGRHRLEGFRDALGHRFDSRFSAQGDFSRDSGNRAMIELLEKVPRLDAVFAANDAMAAGAIAALHAAGRHVPDDVRVAGFDDSSIATETRPQLTTIRQPLTEIGTRMAHLLIRRITTGGPVRSALLPTSLVLRDSA